MSEIDLEALKPKLRVHDLKKQQDMELKQLSKQMKGKALKEKEKELAAQHEKDMADLKKAWEKFKLAEAGELPAEEENKKDDAEEQPTSMYLEREVVLSKAAKKRMQREQREIEAVEKRKEELSKRPDLRAIEQEKLAEKLRNVAFDGPLDGVVGGHIKDIKGDGHCLFRALADQLEMFAKLEGGDSPYTVASLREMASAHMRAHKDDFLPYLIDEDSEDLMTPEEMEEYCRDMAKMEGEVVWGGQAEIVAISAVLGQPIAVHMYDSADVVCGDEFKGKKPTLHVSFHKHLIDLGDHYNSVVPN